jgi:hypothetical protein
MIVTFLFFPVLTSFWSPLSIAESIHPPPQKESASYRMELSGLWKPCSQCSPLLSGFIAHSTSWMALPPIFFPKNTGSSSFPKWKVPLPYARTAGLPPRMAAHSWFFRVSKIYILPTSVASSLKFFHLPGSVERKINYQTKFETRALCHPVHSHCARNAEMNAVWLLLTI